MAKLGVRNRGWSEGVHNKSNKMCGEEGKYDVERNCVKVDVFESEDTRWGVVGCCLMEFSSFSQIRDRCGPTGHKDGSELGAILTFPVNANLDFVL